MSARRVDIFDHLVSEPDDAFLRERAGYLYRSTMWRMAGRVACARGEDETR